MKHKAARREVLRAIAEFDRANLDFAEGMQKALEPAPSAEPASPMPLLEFGPRKPAKRAPPRQVELVRVVRVRR
jgi:hypothetical protein